MQKMQLHNLLYQTVYIGPGALLQQIPLAAIQTSTS